MNVIFTALTPAHHGWIAENLDPIFCDDTRGILALDKDKGTILAAGLMDQWTKTSCQMHVVIRNPFVIRHGFIHEVFTYVFSYCGRKKAFALIPGNNKESVNFAKRIGFSEIGRLPEAYDEGVDYVVCQLDRENCKYIYDESEKEAA